MDIVIWGTPSSYRTQMRDINVDFTNNIDGKEVTVKNQRLSSKNLRFKIYDKTIGAIEFTGRFQFDSTAHSVKRGKPILVGVITSLNLKKRVSFTLGKPEDYDGE